jgi:5'-3' exonuclease
MYDTLIFDFSNIYNVNYFKFSKDKDNDGSGAVVHSLLSIIDYIRKYAHPNIKTSKLIFALDKAWYATDKDSRFYRKQIYPEYKANRPPKEENFIEGFKRATECLKYAFDGSYLVGIGGYEADDLVEPIINFRLKDNPNQKILLIGNDADWFARLRENVHQCQWYKIVTPVGFEELNGFKPHGIVFEKIIRGDRGDNIPLSVMRLPSPSVKHICREYQNSDDLFNRLKEDTVIPPPWKAKIEASKSDIIRNEKLVNPLPIPDALFKRSLYKVEFDRPKLLDIIKDDFTGVVDSIQSLNSL